MKYLITGITGFVGPHLANLLVADGHDVVGLVRYAVRVGLVLSEA